MLSILESSPDLVTLLSTVEFDLNKYMELAPRRPEGPYAEMLPWLMQQLHGWVAAAGTNTAGDSPFFKAPPHPLMFAVTEGSGAHIAKNILDISHGILKPDHYSRLQKCIKTVLPINQLALVHNSGSGSGAGTDLYGAQLGTTAYDDTIPRLPRSTWKDVKYKGDPLRRPVASYEIAMLVSLTVRASQFLNNYLGLDDDNNDGNDETAAAAAATGGGRGQEEEDVPENVVQQVLQKVKRKKYKVDLRPLADMRNLVWIPVAWFTLVIIFKVLAVIGAGILAGLMAPPSSRSRGSHSHGGNAWEGGSMNRHNQNNMDRNQAIRQRQQQQQQQQQEQELLRRPPAHLARQLNQEL
jgi:hypothetical protein